MAGRGTARVAAAFSSAGKVAGAGLVRRGPVRRVLTRTPRARGRGLVLLWHRIAPDGDAGRSAVVPTVPAALFRRQLEALATVGDLVPLSGIERPHEGPRPRFAITFDDDHVGHAAHALPVLCDLGVPATFFLSGRWIGGYGPYWWEVLERRVAADGVPALARRLGVRADDIRELAAAVEGDDEAQRTLSVLGGETEVAVMDGDDARRLRAAGMEIGFHTVHHPALPGLPPAELRAAVEDGRAALSRDADAPVERFAYPHGRCDEAAEAAVADAGYVSAWVTDHQPVDLAASPYRRGRWEPGPRDTDALVRGVLRRLNLPRPRRSSVG